MTGRAARAAASCALAVLVSAALATAAHAAEHAQENAVTAAEDAFGLMVGNQAIGLYSMAEARGFSPQQAGNLRIEGLYFDNPSNYVGPCTAGATMMRIGITAQPYSFPSPTGIADLKLKIPGERPQMSAILSRGPYAETSVLVEGETPLSEHLGGSACGGYSKDFLPTESRTGENLSAGATLRWRPFEHTEIVPFWSNMAGETHENVPQVYTDGDVLPPLFDARRLATLPGTSYGWRTTQLGVVLRQSFGSEWLLNAGLFRAKEQERLSYVDEYLSVQPGGEVYHELDVVPALSSVSTSGEIRLVRRFGGEVHQRQLELSVRGRSSDRAYGGDTLYYYGWTSLDAAGASSPPSLCPPENPPPCTAQPAPPLADHDETRQIDGGLVYEERWQGVGSLGLGLLRGHYRRSIHDRSAVPSDSSSSVAPWLGNLRFTVAAGPAVTFYGSFLQGLEDSALAPTTAVNRGQPPPATRTHQVDAGVRFAAERLSLVLGAFDIHKVYFNLDANSLYTALGTVRHRGLESSLAYGGAGGLTLIAGGVWLRPHVDRTVAEPGATGTVPIGPVPLTLNVNLDYAPARWRPLAASLQWTRLSARTVTTNDQFFLPPLATLNAGLRYETTFRGRPFTVRFDAMNVTDARGLRVTAVEQLVPELGRRFMLSVAIDQ